MNKVPIVWKLMRNMGNSKSNYVDELSSDDADSEYGKFGSL